MPNTLDWTPGGKVQALVFGRSGSGKTWGALTFPRPNVIDFDAGIATVRNPEFVHRYGLVSVEYYQPVEHGLNKQGVPLSHNAFDDACNYFDLWMKPDKADLFDTWVLDSGTTMSEAASNKAIILLGSTQFAGKSGKLSNTHDKAKLTGLLHPVQQDYGAERSLTEQFIRMLKDSGKHVVIIAHEKEKTDDNGNIKARVPLFTGQSSEIVSLMFDNVWHLKIQGVGATRKHVLTTQFDGITNAKSRYGLPEGTEWDWPSINSALEAIRKEQQNAKNSTQTQNPREVQVAVAAGR